MGGCDADATWAARPSHPTFRSSLKRRMRARTTVEPWPVRPSPPRTGRIDGRENEDYPMINPLTEATGQFPGLSRIGALLADPGRAAMLWALMDGSARPAGEL